MKICAAVVSLLTFAALAPRSAGAHCHVQYQVIGPGGLFYDVSFPPYEYRGVLPGGTTNQLGAQVSWSDIRMQEIYHQVNFNLTGTDLTGSVSCPAVSVNMDGPPPCTDDGGGGPPPCTPSFTVTQTAPHVFSCSSTCVSYPQPHPWLANYYTGNAAPPPVSVLSPNSATAGAPSLAVEVQGSGFVGASQVQWNGSSLTTVFVDASTLLALIPSSLLSSPGTSTVTVLNQGGSSSPLSFTVLGAETPPSAPSISGVFPSSAAAGSGALALTINGGGFISSSTALWNGMNLSTVFVSSGQLTAQIPAADLAAATTAAVAVFTPAPGGGTSSTATFTVLGTQTPPPAPSTPTISGIFPSSAAAGSGTFALTIDGAGFISSSTALWNGMNLSTVFVSSGQLTAQIPAADLAAATSAAVAVFTPAPGGGSSTTTVFTVYTPNPGAISQAPTGLTAVALGISSISWTWNAVPGAASYSFYPSSGGPAVPLAGTSFIQTGLSPNTANGARVSASNASGEGPSSASASAYTWAAPPTALTLVQAGVSSVTVSWSAGANPASTTSYRLDYWPAAGSTNSLTTILTQASAPGLAPATTYSLTVTALNGGGVAAPSGIILSVMTGAAAVAAPGAAQNEVVGATGGMVSFASPAGLITAAIPAGTFTTAVSVEIIVPTGFPGGAGSLGNLTGTGVGVQFILNPPVQPLVNTRLTVPYRLSDVAGTDQRTLILARYDDAQNVWVPLVSSVDTLNRTVTAQTDHFSTFQIMQAVPSGTVSTAKAFPNPLRPSLGQTFMTFAALPASARIRIYDLKGVLIKDMTADASGMANWDGTNRSGAAAASGVYFLFAQGAGQSRTLAVAVQR